MKDKKTNKQTKGKLIKFLGNLTEDQKKALNKILGKGLNKDADLEKVGKEFKATRERIREIEAKALRKLNRTKPEPPDDVA